MDMFHDLQCLYQGFWLEEPVGNNAFSYQDRSCRRIYVAPLISGGIEDVTSGQEPAFVEIVDGTEVVCYGLKNFVRFLWRGTEVFVCDNHNHALCFWAYAKLTGVIRDQAVLVHVDQHKDTRRPQTLLSEFENLSDVFDYTNRVLNVGNFIPPAQEAGLVGEVIQVNGSDHMKCLDIKKPFVLDIDLDWFAESMDYIPWDQKCKFLYECAKEACFITVATSPYFIDYDLAVRAMKNIFSLE